MVLHEVNLDSLGTSAARADLIAPLDRDFGGRWATRASAMGKALAGGSGWVLRACRRGSVRALPPGPERTLGHGDPQVGQPLDAARASCAYMDLCALSIGTVRAHNPFLAS
jgi:hypothetical protein